MRLLLIASLLFFTNATQPSERTWIRINLLGYKPQGIKVAVWGTKESRLLKSFQIIDAATRQVVFEGNAGSSLGAYGPFTTTYRLNFSKFTKPGKYQVKTGRVLSPAFEINKDVYKGLADFCLQYMRQQRSGFNPFLKDSCHTQDGYTVYGPMPDSTHVDVSGGWHDATDYLQYTTTSANATYHLLAAYRDFPGVFADQHSESGLKGKNGKADVLDEARWGLDWLLKMHPEDDQMFNQLADDRDHVGFRLPVGDKANYGKGAERPVYFVTGDPQGLSKYKNNTTGTSSSAAKFSSAFALAHQIYKKEDEAFAYHLKHRSLTAWKFALRKPGYTQTASYLSPYIYQEENWVDDMELAATQLFILTGDQSYKSEAFRYAQQEKQTPWLGKDTASHYQWYPFINPGHFEMSKLGDPQIAKASIGFYKDGIELVSQKGKNAFLRGVPFIWCSNNLQTAFAIQCYWYRRMSGDRNYAELEQAAFDWLFGCNPWGTSMVVGLPDGGDFPAAVHSSYTVLNGDLTYGGLVDGPVYGSIYKQQRGVTLTEPDEYAEFQSDKVVYHDDIGDYSTNEPTMDGTAILIYLLAAMESER
jgi:endoglucanase